MTHVNVTQQMRYVSARSHTAPRTVAYHVRPPRMSMGGLPLKKNFCKRAASRQRRYAWPSINACALWPVRLRSFGAWPLQSKRLV